MNIILFNRFFQIVSPFVLFLFSFFLLLSLPTSLFSTPATDNSSYYNISIVLNAQQLDSTNINTIDTQPNDQNTPDTLENNNNCNKEKEYIEWRKNFKKNFPKKYAFWEQKKNQYPLVLFLFFG